MCTATYFSSWRGVRTVGDMDFKNEGGRDRHLEILGDAGNSGRPIWPPGLAWKEALRETVFKPYKPVFLQRHLLPVLSLAGTSAFWSLFSLSVRGVITLP